MEPIDLKTIPVSPGVYLYKDAHGRVVYVGKAKHLRKRVASYFRPPETQTSKTRAMLRQAQTITTLITTTEKEALLLEASLIKKHRPRYNILLRDDKQYVLFKLNKKHRWPRLTLTRKVLKDGSKYFGPFTSSHSAWETLKAVHKVFMLRRCADRAFSNRVRPCLYHHIGQCLAPCCLEISHNDYSEQVHRVELLLSGKSNELVEILTAKMYAASESMDFETAAQLRDQIKAVEVTVEKQAAVIPTAHDMDVIGLGETEKGLALGVLFIRGGILIDKKNYFWAGLGLEEAPELLQSFIAQYYGVNSFVPSRVVVPWGNDVLGDETNAEPLVAHAEALTELRGMQVRVAPPRNDTESKLVTMATANAIDDSKNKRNISPLTILQKRLGLAEEPYRTEIVDVSHTSGKDTRVGMVVFEGESPAKSEYRTYAFTDEEGGGDDYGVLALWMERRLNSGPPWPDLLLIDGGRGQLNAVVSVLEAHGQADLCSVISIAKARKDETGRADRRKGNIEDRIFLPGRSNPLQLKAGAPELLLLQHMRDLCHDYSIGRHRKARAGRALSGELQRIPGIGPSMAKKLWTHYSSVKEMAAASVTDLMQIDGVGKKKAVAIYEGLSVFRG